MDSKKFNYPAKNIAIHLEDSFWISSDSRMKNNIIGIRLRNELNSPYTNFEYPYQLVFNFYSPGYSYFADMTQMMGGIKTNGQISYQFGWDGEMIDKNTIRWFNDGSVWVRVTPPRNTKNNQYDTTSILTKDRNVTTYLSNRMQDAYPLQPGLPGM